MKVELDYVKKAVVYEIKEIKMKNDKVFYSRNLLLNSGYGDILITLKGKNRSDIMITEFKEEVSDEKSETGQGQNEAPDDKKAKA